MSLYKCYQNLDQILAQIPWKSHSGCFLVDQVLTLVDQVKLSVCTAKIPGNQVSTWSTRWGSLFALQNFLVDWVSTMVDQLRLSVCSAHLCALLMYGWPIWLVLNHYELVWPKTDCLTKFWQVWHEFAWFDRSLNEFWLKFDYRSMNSSLIEGQNKNHLILFTVTAPLCLSCPTAFARPSAAAPTLIFLPAIRAVALCLRTCSSKTHTDTNLLTLSSSLRVKGLPRNWNAHDTWVYMLVKFTLN